MTITLLVEDHLDSSSSRTSGTSAAATATSSWTPGNGIGDLRAELDPFVEGRPVVAVATHDHFDHIGGMHAFEERWCHAADAEGLREPDGLALLRRDYRPGLEDEIRWYGYEPPEVVITALPERGVRPGGLADAPGGAHAASSRTATSWTSAIVPSRSSTSRDTPPGRSPSGMRPSGLLFTGDTAALDDPLYAEDEEAFVASLGRLRALPVDLVCAGHSRPFGREELRALIDEQLEARSHG